MKLWPADSPRQCSVLCPWSPWSPSALSCPPHVHFFHTSSLQATAPFCYCFNRLLLRLTFSFPVPALFPSLPLGSQLQGSCLWPAVPAPMHTLSIFQPKPLQSQYVFFPCALSIMEISIGWMLNWVTKCTLLAHRRQPSQSALSGWGKVPGNEPVGSLQ